MQHHGWALMAPGKARGAASGTCAALVEPSHGAQCCDPLLFPSQLRRRLCCLSGAAASAIPDPPGDRLELAHSDQCQTTADTGDNPEGALLPE